MHETWRDIPEWEGLYQVSNLGRVRSMNRHVKGRWGPTFYRGRILKPGGIKYPVVHLTETGRSLRVYVHDLVLLAYRGPKPKGMEVCHGALGAWVNCLSNLRYDTRSANAQEGWRNRK